VAGEAGVASGTIYLYFKSKDELLIKVFEESLDRIIIKIKEDLEKIPEPRDKLRAFIESHLRMLRERRELAEVLQVELRQSHKFMKEYEPEKWVQYLNIIADILKLGQNKGVFRKDLSMGVFKRAVFGALDEIALHWVLTRKDETYLETATEQLTLILMKGVEIRGNEAGKAGAETRLKKAARSA
jgi:TetR/AcrR family fatty acid metabolism transcriptional regulator